MINFNCSEGQIVISDQSQVGIAVHGATAVGQYYWPISAVDNLGE
ncbi:hypothetical protein [Thalassotalea sp. ND16A]|nr:hypothetical protein [Thalassotalea sp. ND16A]